MLTRRYTSGAFLLISLSCGEPDAACTPFPTSSGCSGAGGVGDGEGVEGGEDWGVSEGVRGVDSDSEGEMLWDRDPLESHWSNTSYSVMSKSCPVPWKKVGGRDEQHVTPVSGILNWKPNTFCVIAVKRHLILVSGDYESSYHNALLFCRPQRRGQIGSYDKLEAICWSTNKPNKPVLIKSPFFFLVSAGLCALRPIFILIMQW